MNAEPLNQRDKFADNMWTQWIACNFCTCDQTTVINVCCSNL